MMAEGHESGGQRRMARATAAAAGRPKAAAAAPPTAWELRKAAQHAAMTARVHAEAERGKAASMVSFLGASE